MGNLCGKATNIIFGPRETGYLIILNLEYIKYKY